ncbi:related to cytochrome P450 phenylacetate hydroxylase [Cephalotrichum gorgonifer]|uniref:Related to cytochrome P450 phenylacetate hydroxylase n=1 Tax=Cephalotrichum gorgonifer TaxID=2041049 RepID=A0AAE8SXU6_9PEZI|nr:related to cytochrome P450 phenylacetate hydroxylase [Cephalotrichum gorgonifer]
MKGTLLSIIGDAAEIQPPYYVLLVLATPAILLTLYLAYNELQRYRLRVPNLPGPLGFPLVGSLPSLRNKITAEEFRLWAARYGDVFQVQLGSSTVVVVNSAAAAEALFIRQREATNSRPIFYVLHKKVQGNGPVTSIGTSPWDHSCKRRRKVAASALNRPSVESYLPILGLESRAFLLDILRGCQGGKVALDVIGPARKFAMNLSLTVSYGTRVEDMRDFSTDSILKEIIHIEEEISRLRETSSNYANYIPLLRPLNTIAEFLGLQDGSYLADIGKRRHAYHAKLQANLRAEIARGVDKPCIQGNVLRDPESKGLSEGELLSVSLSMMAGADTSKRSLMWACLLLAYRPDIQEKAYRAIVEADEALLTALNVAGSKVEYIEALTKEIGRYFVVLRLALPKATHSEVTWNGAVIPPKTVVFLNSWACSRDPAVFQDPDTFAPERWLGGESQAHRHQYAFGIGGRMCVASQLASKALYTVFLHLIAHFELLPAQNEPNPEAADPLRGLLEDENSRVAPRVHHVRFVPRNADATRRMLSQGA